MREDIKEPEDVKEKAGKKHKHDTPVKSGDKYICPHCKAEVPVRQDCPQCKAQIDWTKI